MRWSIPSSTRSALATVRAWLGTVGRLADYLDFALSPDDRRLLMSRSDAQDTGEAPPVVQTPASELHGRFSPDGQWIAYASDESRRWEVYVRRTDGLGERVLLSTAGGFEPRWRADGREVFYITPGRQIMAVNVEAGERLRPGPPQPLVRGYIDTLSTALNAANGFRKTYTVTSDGQRFLLNVLAGDRNSQTINVILNWSALLRDRPR